MKKLNHRAPFFTIALVFTMVFAGVVLAAAASGYTLFGDAQLVSPGNNSPTGAQTRSSATVPPNYGGIDFDVVEGLTLADLDKLSTDYKFTEGSCGGGSPRFQLNTPEGNIFVYIGPYPNYTGCQTGVWQSTGDLLETGMYVDTSQIGGTFYDPYENAVAQFGDLEITGIQLVTDAFWFAGTQTVVFDNVMINNRTFTFESKDSCKNGGWQNFTTAPGPFRNQGQCVSHFARGGE